MADSTNEPGNTLEDNVQYLLSRCTFAVRDHSGDRTGSRGVEDLAGSLAITFLKMEQMAQRYEWLRDHSNAAPDDTPTVYSHRVVRQAAILHGAKLDAAIDKQLSYRTPEVPHV